MSSNTTDNNEYRTDQFNYFSKIHIYIIEKHRKIEQYLFNIIMNIYIIILNYY